MKRSIRMIPAIMLTSLVLHGCSAGGESAASAQQATTPPATSAQSTSTPAPAPLAENEHVTVALEKLYEEDFIQGAAYLTLAVTNNSDREIWVYLEKASVNDKQLPMVGSGAPMYIIPGKTSRNPFILSYASLSIESVTEIHSLEFDIVVADRESLDEISRISGVQVTP